jgi:N-acetylglucosaminyl-diphospho-decaprenol L-rhamnosyltransferase
MKISIIIVSWNTRDLLEKCLASVYADTSLPADKVEIIVVDNASTDDSAGMVRSRFPATRLIENQVNIGFARANNQALRQAAGDYLVLLNPDTVLHLPVWGPLVDFMEAHPRTGAAGTRLLNPDGSLQISCYPAPSLGREVWRLFHLDILRPLATYPMARWPVDLPRAVDVVQGACMILRRTALEQIGLLDEDYFIYSEEVDLCYRLRRGGWGIYWLPTAQVTHYGGQSTRQVATEMFLWLYQGKVLYFEKHYGRLTAIIYKIILALASLVRLGLSPLTSPHAPAQRGQNQALADRYRQLLISLPLMGTTYDANAHKDSAVIARRV